MISSPNVSMAFQKLKEAKIVDMAKKGYDIVKEEISSNPTKRRHGYGQACSLILRLNGAMKTFKSTPRDNAKDCDYDHCRPDNPALLRVVVGRVG